MNPSKTAWNEPTEQPMGSKIMPLRKADPRHDQKSGLMRVSSFANTVSEDRAPSRLANLIAEYRRAHDRAAEAWLRVQHIETQHDLPELRVSALRGCEVGTVWLHTPGDIDRHCEWFATVPVGTNASAVERRRSEFHAEMNHLAASRRHQREVSGLKAAEEEHEAEQGRLLDAREALLSHVPLTLDEFRERDSFIHEQILAGLEHRTFNPAHSLLP